VPFRDRACGKSDSDCNAAAGRDKRKLAHYARGNVLLEAYGRGYDTLPCGSSGGTADKSLKKILSAADGSHGYGGAMPH
jgi:hypothetical protein